MVNNRNNGSLLATDRHLPAGPGDDVRDHDPELGPALQDAINIYIYIYRERERKKERKREIHIHIYVYMYKYI